ncbi:MAG: M20/M25/M40 family metallo-hydrolase [Hyphomicrobiaceae bacterium]
MTDKSREAVLAAIDATHQEQVRFLAELIKIPADNPPGDCNPHAERAAELLRALAFAVETHGIPNELARARGMISASNLVVRERFGEGPTIALNANGDAVRPGEGWTVSAYGAQIRDGAMYGRGAAWAKSDFATFAFALKALKSCNAKVRGTVELHFTYDEEVGGEIGPKWLLDQGLTQPDFAIVSAFSYSVLTSHNGCLHLEVTIRGKSAHAMAPNEGDDALEAATTVLRALYKHRKTYTKQKSSVPGIQSPTLNIGLISGGINTNVVPDRITFTIDRRMIPEEDPKEVEAAVREVIGKAAAKHRGISCAIRCTMLARPLTSLPGQEILVKAIQRNARSVFGEDLQANGMPIYTDARHYGAAGIPTVLYGAGPRTMEEAGVHMADEHVRLDDVLRATKVIALTLMDVLGTDEI